MLFALIFLIEEFDHFSKLTFDMITAHAQTSFYGAKIVMNPCSQLLFPYKHATEDIIETCIAFQKLFVKVWERISTSIHIFPSLDHLFQETVPCVRI